MPPGRDVLDEYQVVICFSLSLGRSSLPQTHHLLWHSSISHCVWQHCSYTSLWKEGLRVRKNAFCRYMITKCLKILKGDCCVGYSMWALYGQLVYLSNHAFTHNLNYLLSEDVWLPAIWKNILHDSYCLTDFLRL